MIAQAQINSVGCAIALDSATKSVAFNRQGNLPAFIEQRDPQVIWAKGAMNVGGVEYKYNTMYSLDAPEHKSLRDYIEWLIAKDYEAPVFQGFSFHQM